VDEQCRPGDRRGQVLGRKPTWEPYGVPEVTPGDRGLQFGTQAGLLRAVRAEDEKPGGRRTLQHPFGCEKEVKRTLEALKSADHDDLGAVTWIKTTGRPRRSAVPRRRSGNQARRVATRAYDDRFDGWLSGRNGCCRLFVDCEPHAAEELGGTIEDAS